MKEMTKTALQDAFAGESQAHMKYLAFSAAAEKEGKPNVARLFKAIAYAEQVHAINHAKNLGYLGSTSENLEAAEGGENFEIEEMYPVYNNTAKFQGEAGAEKSTHYALEAEKIHSKMYNDAHTVVQGGSDITIDVIRICPVCGHTVEGEAPEACPVCKAKGSSFVAFE